MTKKRRQLADLLSSLQIVQQHLEDFLQVRGLTIKNISIGTSDVYFYFSEPHGTDAVLKTNAFAVGDMYVTLDEGLKGPLGLQISFNSE